MQWFHIGIFAKGILGNGLSLQPVWENKMGSNAKGRLFFPGLITAVSATFWEAYGIEL